MTPEEVVATFGPDGLEDVCARCKAPNPGIEYAFDIRSEHAGERVVLPFCSEDCHTVFCAAILAIGAAASL